VPSAVTVRLQRRKGAKPFTVHIDKVKPYPGDTPKTWIGAETVTERTAENESIDVEETQPKRIEESEHEWVDAENEALGTKVKESLSMDRAEKDYTVDETSFRERPKRDVRPPAHLKNYVRLVRRKLSC